jgi:lipoprotein-anchoring transpeptidase ErfK/SrfK
MNLARQALQRGERRQARQHAARAAVLAPELEDPWLLLAAVASPRASLAYLNRALQINPSSKRARSGMHWAAGRMRQEANAVRALTTDGGPRTTDERRRTTEDRRRTSRAARRGLLLALLCLAAVLLAWALAPRLGQATGQARQVALGLLASDTPTPSQTPAASPTPSETPTASASPTPSLTATATSTATPTETATPTATASFTPTSTATETPTVTPTAPPTATFTPHPPKKKPKPTAQTAPSARPLDVNGEENWVDVDLSGQTVYAMHGDQVVNSFIVSTGLWPNVTVTGEYRIYVKYRYADMYGDDYYLSNVPYVMYFYKGYGLHGTYWHNNFGQPMSHGCVNLRTPDAGWLFDFASVGTLVNVHE